MKKAWPLFILILFTFQSCGFRHLKDGSDGENVEVSAQSELTTSVYYATIEKKILAPKCLSCHSDAGGNLGGVNLETYEEALKHIGAIKQKSLIEKSMPPKNPLNNSEKNLLGSWISSGAPFDETNQMPSTNQNTTNKITVTWSKIRNKIIENHCIQCHSPPILNPTTDTVSTMEAGLDLTKFEVVKDKSDLIFKRIVISNDMPLRPYPPLSNYEKKLITEWMISGMPDDVESQ